MNRCLKGQLVELRSHRHRPKPMVPRWSQPVPTMPESAHPGLLLVVLEPTAFCYLHQCAGCAHPCLHLIEPGADSCQRSLVLQPSTVCTATFHNLCHHWSLGMDSRGQSQQRNHQDQACQINITHRFSGAEVQRQAGNSSDH